MWLVGVVRKGERGEDEADFGEGCDARRLDDMLEKGARWRKDRGTLRCRLDRYAFATSASLTSRTQCVG